MTDPLDERRRDPRDVVVPPHRFATALGTNRMRQMDMVEDGLFRAQVYWTYGSAPKGAPRSDVDDPPCSGWSAVFVMPDERGLVLWHPWSFRSYRVREDSYEASSLQGSVEGFDARARAFYRDRLPTKWMELKAHGQDAQADWSTAARIMAAVGAAVPSEEDAVAFAQRLPAKRTVQSVERAVRAAEPKTKAGAFKPVKADSRKGQVLRFFVDGGTSADKAMSQLGIQRNNLLSQLFLLRKDHGIEYKVAGDVVQLAIPEGQELFA